MIGSGALTLKFRPGLRLSDEAFWRLCRANPNLRLERSARGELIIMAPAGSDSSRRNTSLVAQLWNWKEANGLGVVFGPSAGFTLPNTAIKDPDAAWMAQDRWDALTVEQKEKFAPVCPEFVAEVRSASDKKKDLRDKMREYIAQGTRLGWLVDPKFGTVEIYRPGRPVEILRRPMTLSGEDVLPNFVLDLRGILFD
jgi:Uma2 family endonuclease